MKPKLIYILLPVLCFFFEGISQHIVINEIAYSNKGLLSDKDGDSPDWIELYNAGSEIINLNHYSITDDTIKIEKWIFPNCYLKPDSTIIIFASGKNIREGKELHTNFKLKQRQDTLFFFDNHGFLIDEVAPVCIPDFRTYARVPDGSENWKITSISPMKTNNNSTIFTINFIPDTLKVNYQSGFYKNQIELQFTNDIASNKIMYTLNGEEPDENSDFFNKSLLLSDLTNEKNRFANKAKTEFEPGDLITKANIVRAQVFSDGCPASNEIANTYFINTDILEKSEVPVISIITAKDNLFDNDEGIYVKGNNENFLQHGKSWERQVQLEIFDTTGSLQINQDAGIRIHGRASRNGDQKSFRLYAREKYGKEYFEHKLFTQKPEIEKYKTMVLRASRDWKARTLFKDEMCQYLIQNMNINYTAYQTSIVFINGEYWGIYSLRERQDAYYIAENYKIDVPGVDILSHSMSEVSVEEGDIDEYNKLIRALNNLDVNAANFPEEVNILIDVNELIDFYVAQIYFANSDFPKNNLKMWRIKEDTAQWHFFFFDMDASMVDVNHNLLSEYNNNIDILQWYPEFSKEILRKLLENETFRNTFYSRFNYHLNTTFSTQSVLDAISFFEKRYAPLVHNHIYRWGTPVDYKKWESNVDKLETFAVQRSLYLSEQLYDNFGSPFIISPNPCVSECKISNKNGAENTIDQVNVYDMNGKPVYRKLHGCAETCNMQFNLSAGLYHMKISSDGKKYSELLLIK